MEGGRRIQALLDDMERARGTIMAKNTWTWLFVCRSSAYILRSHNGSLYTMRDGVAVMVGKDPTVCAVHDHHPDSGHTYPVFSGTVLLPALAHKAAEAAKAVGGNEAWAASVSKYVRFDLTMWRLWSHVWWSGADTIPGTRSPT